MRFLTVLLLALILIAIGLHPYLPSIRGVARAGQRTIDSLGITSLRKYFENETGSKKQGSGKPVDHLTTKDRKELQKLVDGL